MDGIRVASSEALLELMAGLKLYAEHSASIARDMQFRASQCLGRLEEQRCQWERQIEYWESRISNADEEEDTSEYYAQLHRCEARLEATRRHLDQVQTQADAFQSKARVIEMLAQDRTPAAVHYLQGQLERLDDYLALRPPGMGGDDDIGGGTVSSKASSSSRSFGYLPPKQDDRDWLWHKLYGPIPHNLPQRVNLESLCGPAYDQKDRPECVCFSLAALKHHDVYQEKGKWITLDPSATYKQCKILDDAPEEAGTTIRSAFKAAKRYGLRDENGQSHFVRGYARLENCAEVRHALSLGKVVMVGLHTDSAKFARLDRDRTVVQSQQAEDGHCMLLVGYDTTTDQYRIRNSWGTAWADAGHCWISGAYLAAEKDPDFWTSVCEKVAEPPSVEEATTPFPRRETHPSSNYAWIAPSDVLLAPEDGDALEWNRITKEKAQETLEMVSRMRPWLKPENLRPGSMDSVREALATATDRQGDVLFSEADLNVFDLYFRSDAIRIDIDGLGGLTAINGRHRLWIAQKMGGSSLPVSLSNAARRYIAGLEKENHG